MGRITIINSISAVLLGGIGLVIGALFGAEPMRWGMLIGGIFGFLFPSIPLAIVIRIREWFRRGENRWAGTRDEEKS